MGHMNSIVTAPPPQSPTPWWMQAVERFGVPAAFAGYLIWQLVGGQATLLKNINETLLAQKGAVANVAVVTTKTAIDAEAARIRLEGYLRLVCVNTARTSADRNTCLSVR